MFGNKKAYARARAKGYRSGLEVKAAQQLEDGGIPFRYEPGPIRYTVPERVAKYTPDIFLKNGIVIETKGIFSTEDRAKTILVKNQFPDLDLRLVFSNPNTRISKQSATTYAAWCESKGIAFAKFPIPAAWIAEPGTPARIKAMVDALGLDPFLTSK